MSGLDNLKTRLQYAGGKKQESRMQADKLKTLKKALLYSYQAATAVLDDGREFKCLINPDKLKQDYDDKIISIGYEYNFKPGDVFEWIGTNTHWLIYLQDLTELAYFRGDIRKCSYEIAWQDEDGEHSTYVALRGPVETKINYIQKHGISVDTPNYSLNMLIPLNDATLKYFQRYSKFYLQSDTNEYMNNVCWRVEAIDWLSTPGILEVAAVEYYANETEDDIENGIVGGLTVKPANPNDEEVEEAIIGETFIKPKKEYEFYFNGGLYLDWEIDKKYPVSIIVDEMDPKRIKLKWNSSYSGQFDLVYGSYVKTVIVESLF